jgi:hypothetical protein
LGFVGDRFDLCFLEGKSFCPARKYPARINKNRKVLFITNPVPFEGTGFFYV